MENNKILEKVKMKIAISNIQKEDIEMNKNKINIAKGIGIAACILLSTTSVVFASSVIYEKVFKEPKKYASYNEMIEEIKESQNFGEITEEDIKETITIEEAQIKANEFLSKLGYEMQEFSIKELKKDLDLYYFFATDINLNNGIHVEINANNGKCLRFVDEDLKYSQFEADKISKEETIEKSKEIYNILELKEGEYKIKSIEEVPYYFENTKIVDEWCITYYKDYGGTLNQFERVEMRFAVVNGSLKINSASVGKENVKYEDNPIIITEEEAKKIALEQDKKLTDNEVESVNIKLQIRQINSWIYVLEQNGGVYPKHNEELVDGANVIYPEYKTTENIARKVWTVNIHYKQGEKDLNNDKKYHSKSIFVDVTTGEVIGGADESI